MDKYQYAQLNYTNNNIIYNHKLSYVTFGQINENFDNVILCVHALTRNCRDFDFLADFLAHKGYYVISVDIVGRGRSYFLEDYSLYNYNTYVNDIKNLLDILNIKNCSWIGSSMGGLIGMFFSAIYPEYIKSLILNDVGPFIPKNALENIAKYVGIMPIFNDLHAVEKYLKTALVPFGIKEQEHWHHLAKYGCRHIENGKLTLAYDGNIAKKLFAASDGKIVDAVMWDVWDKIKGLDILVLRGELSNILLPETYNQMIESSPTVKGNICLNVGHIPNLMDKEHKDYIYNFIKELYI